MSSSTAGVWFGRWDELPATDVRHGVRRREVHGRDLMVTRNDVQPDMTPRGEGHRHPQEQILLVLDGTIALTVDGETREMSAGSFCVIPSGVVHGSRVVGSGPAVIVDIFTPLIDEYVVDGRWQRIEDEREERVVPESVGERYLVGLMSGTSTDGVDAALVKVAGFGMEQRVELLHCLTRAFDEEMRERIFGIYPPNLTLSEEISRLNFDLGEIYAQAAIDVAAEGGIELDHLDGIGSRGLTVFHGPPELGDGRRGHRLEIGEAAVIAERTGVTVVSDYGYRDQAAYGLGGTIGSYVDYLLFHNAELGTAIQNIGGIGNVTSITPGEDPYSIISYDTGPGNVFIDFAAERATGGQQRYDVDGKLARAGKVDHELVRELNEHPYIHKPPPKSTGREVFTTDMWQDIVAKATARGLSDEDIVATMTAYTAQSILLSFQKYVFPRGQLDRVVLRGGGAYNPVIKEMLGELFDPIPVLLHEEFGIPAHAREALDWAVQAGESLLGRPNNLPNVTGAARRIVFGKFTPGKFEWDHVPFVRS